jgi:prepilin-type N-terminal cleavage/methylation domain-containing protein
MRGRGYTLLELLIALGLLGLVASLVSLMLVRTLKLSQKGLSRVDMQQQASLALQRMLTDLRRTSCAGLSLRSSADPKGLAICPISSPQLRSGQPEPVQGDGLLRWSDFFLLYYHDRLGQRMLYREWPPGSPSASAAELSISRARRLDPARLLEVLQGVGRTVVLAQGVSDFEIVHAFGGRDDLVIQPLRFRLSLFRGSEKLQLVRSVFLAEQR